MGIKKINLKKVEDIRGEDRNGDFKKYDNRGECRDGY